MRLDKALALHPIIESRSQATSLIDRGLVIACNGRTVKPAHITQLAEEYTVTLQESEPVELVPYNFQLEIVYEDEDVIIVNKPHGLVVHPAIGHRQDTLVNALIYHTRELAAGFERGRPGIVHRIDKETSGLLVVAKNDSAMRSLANQFKKKTVHRIYWAVTFGHFNQMANTITSYIRRHPIDRKKFSSERLTGEMTPQGKLAITHYEVKKAAATGVSLVHCQLETGRTHQIRVHLSELQHPIVGDPVYCTSGRHLRLKSTKLRGSLSKNPYMLLHAAELGFFHPTQKKSLRFQAPWPKEVIPLLIELGVL